MLYYKWLGIQVYAHTRWISTKECHIYLSHMQLALNRETQALKPNTKWLILSDALILEVCFSGTYLQGIGKRMQIDVLP